jgi:hypothetical protein
LSLLLAQFKTSRDLCSIVPGISLPTYRKTNGSVDDGREQVGGIRPLSDAGSLPARDPLNARAAQRPAKENEAWRPHSGEMYGPGLSVKSRLWDKRVTSSGPNSSLGSRHAACRQAFRLTGRQVRAVAPRRCPSAVHSAAAFPAGREAAVGPSVAA